MHRKLTAEEKKAIRRKKNTESAAKSRARAKDNLANLEARTRTLRDEIQQEQLNIAGLRETNIHLKDEIKFLKGLAEQAGLDFNSPETQETSFWSSSTPTFFQMPEQVDMMPDPFPEPEGSLTFHFSQDKD